MHRLHADPPSAPPVEHRDVSYRGGLPARIYLPAGEGPFPGLVLVHGGSWCLGDRFTHERTSERLAASGIVTMAIEFRMPPQARYPEPIADIAAAIEWLAEHASGFSVDDERIGGFGFSSGAHQLLLATLRPGDPRWSAGSARCAMLIAAFPVSDPLARYRMAQERSLTQLLDAHHAYWPDELAMAEGNPQLLLERGDAQALPPLLVLAGTADENLTGDMVQRLVGAYRAAGGDATLELFDGEPHAFIDRSPASAASSRALELAIEFARGASRR
jgi:acetyl esterase/lipase